MEYYPYWKMEDQDTCETLTVDVVSLLLSISDNVYKMCILFYLSRYDNNCWVEFQLHLHSSNKGNITNVQFQTWL